MPPTGAAVMLRIEFRAEGRVNGTPFCTSNEITLHDDGTWLLRITAPPDTKPVIDLAGQPATPAGVIAATIRATFEAIVATAANPG